MESKDETLKKIHKNLVYTVLTTPFLSAKLIVARYVIFY